MPQLPLALMTEMNEGKHNLNQPHGRSTRSGLFLYAGENLKKANHHLRQGSDEAGQFVERSRETIHYLAPTAATALPGAVIPDKVIG